MEDKQHDIEESSSSEKTNEADSSSDHDEANNSGEIMEEFSVEEELLFARRLEEGYDLSDPRYDAWMKINAREQTHIQSSVITLPSQPSVMPPPSAPGQLSAVSSLDQPNPSSGVTFSCIQVASFQPAVADSSQPSPSSVTLASTPTVTPSSQPGLDTLTSPTPSTVTPSSKSGSVTLTSSIPSAVTPSSQPGSVTLTSSIPSAVTPSPQPDTVTTTAITPKRPANAKHSPLSDLLNLPKWKGPKPKTGHAHVLTSAECLSILKEKEKEKKRREVEEKENRKEERLLKKKQKEEEQKRKEEEIAHKAAGREEKRRCMEEEKIHRATEREAKRLAARGKRPALRKRTAEASATTDENHAAGSAQESTSGDANGRPVRKKHRLGVDSVIYTDLCCVCFGSFQEDEGTGREWLKCPCGRWIHDDCIMPYSSSSNKLCPLC